MKNRQHCTRSTKRNIPETQNMPQKHAGYVHYMYTYINIHVCVIHVDFSPTATDETLDRPFFPFPNTDDTLGTQNPTIESPVRRSNATHATKNSRRCPP